jgi:hypothetical protein
MDFMQHRDSSFVLPCGRRAFGLLTFIAIDIAMTIIALVRYPAFFSQPGARILVVQLACALLAYSVAIVFIARTHGPYWGSILSAAIVFGILTGTLEIMNIGIENGLPFAARGPILPIGFMLTVFTLWGIAGFRTTRTLRSTRAGLLAALSSAAICMLIAVAAGFIIELWVLPPEPTFVSTWAEFKRSGWTDVRAFAIANTLDSGFTHLVIAPIIALFFGGIGSLLAQFKSSRATSASS